VRSEDDRRRNPEEEVRMTPHSLRHVVLCAALTAASGTEAEILEESV
jgi:hypothetical protein